LEPEERRTIIILLITLILALYLMFLTWNSSSFMDVWPLEGIFWETVAVVVAISLLSYLLFDNRASVIILLITQAFLVVVLPILKYPNALSITGLGIAQPIIRLLSGLLPMAMSIQLEFYIIPTTTDIILVTVSYLLY